jgi:hypothetical protein
MSSLRRRAHPRAPRGPRAGVVREVDIDTDDALMRDYGVRIPVVRWTVS